MRSIVLGVCLLTAGCSGQASNSPTSPTSTAFAPAQARSGAELPFRGSLTTATTAVFAGPTMFATADADGTAINVGQFTARLTAVVDLPTSTSTGEFRLTAANGDQLSGTFIGEGVTIGPGMARLTEVATITGGTGRFEGATGAFTMVRIDTIDAATGRASGTGTIEGIINLNK